MARRRTAAPQSSEAQREYWRCYYRRNREKIIAQVSENRRRRKRELREHLTKLGLYPPPPDYLKRLAKQRQRQALTIKRILDLPDVYSETEEEGDAPAEGRGHRDAAAGDNRLGD